MSKRPEFGDAPVLATLVKEKITDPVDKQSFDYWTSLTTIDKWFALPPGTPEPIVKAYQQAYEKIGKDEEFLAKARKISEDIEPQSAADVKRLIDTLGTIPTPAIERSASAAADSAPIESRQRGESTGVHCRVAVKQGRHLRCIDSGGPAKITRSHPTATLPHWHTAAGSRSPAASKPI